MSVFRIKKNNNYTIMSNYHLREKELTLRSKGLLSLMLSLPDEWDYTLKGLSIICKEGIDAIRGSITELENSGYIERRRNRNEKGQLTNTEYIIYEHPILHKPTLENPTLDNHTQGKPILANHTQINTDKTNIQELNTDGIKHQSINVSDTGLIDRYTQNIEEVKRNIEYASLIQSYDKTIIDEIVAVMAEVLTVDTPFCLIEKKQYPTELVRKRFLEINNSKLEAFLIEFNRRNEKIHNIKAYLITSLFNIPATADTNLSNMVRNDLYGN